MQVQGVFSQQTQMDNASSRNLQKEKSTTTNSSSKATPDQQVVMTKNKCRIDSVQTVKQKGENDDQVKEVTIKKANFHDQVVKINVKIDSSVQNV